ncbi:MAG TPA: hypothetical protein DCS93_12635 [Microscillaceae bacterium]|nr:hypothetical protein [Microscillaceae bacterium]
MKFFGIIILLLVSSLCGVSQGLVGKTRLNLFPRTGPISFTIGPKSYWGTGLSNDIFGGPSEVVKDIWTYDPANDTWTQVSDFGGVARRDAVAFVVDSKGYVGCGRGDSGHYKDFWVYDPATNQWTQKADFGGGARIYTAAFSINNKAYVGTGIASTGGLLNDFWEYDAVNDQWIQKNNFAGNARSEASSFAMSGKGYLGFGKFNGAVQNDFWEYNPSDDSWVQKSRIPTTFFVNITWQAGASLNNTRGFIFLSNSRLLEYKSANDSWESKLPDGTTFPYGTANMFTNGNVFLVAGATNNTNVVFAYRTDFINPITTLQATTISNAQIDLTWDDEATEEEKYLIYRSTTSGSSFVQIAEVGANVTTYADQNLDPDVTYYYKVKGVNLSSAIESDFSNEASATTSLNANISLQAFSQSLNAVRLAWSSDNATIDGYKIERSEDEAQGYTEITEIPVASAAGHIDQNLEPGKTYFYRIRAFRGTSFSEYSNRIGANTLVTGVNNALAQQIKVLNNPNTTGIFQIKTGGLNIQNWQVELRDGQMKVLPKNLVLKNNAGYQIDLRQRASGVYFIILDTSNGKVIKRLIRL